MVIARASNWFHKPKYVPREQFPSWSVVNDEGRRIFGPATHRACTRFMKENDSPVKI